VSCTSTINRGGLFAWPPNQLKLKTALPAGKHALEVRVSGSPRNQMGPHFSKGLPIIFSWIYGAKTQQPGEKYMLWPCGLNERPAVEIQSANTMSSPHMPRRRFLQNMALTGSALTIASPQMLSATGPSDSSSKEQPPKRGVLQQPAVETIQGDR